MTSLAMDSQDRTAEDAVRALHAELLASWNRRDAAANAALFTADGYVVGFDGSQMDGRDQVAAELAAIFADHVTAPYIGKIGGVRFLTPDVAIRRARVGMIPPGYVDLNPAANALQTMVATREGDTWRITLFQNTPAQFHGRPELVERMTDELRELM